MDVTPDTIEQASPQRDGLEEVCEVCGGPGASRVAYERVVSYLVLTDSQKIEKCLCAACSSRAGFREHALSSLMGWWGVPFGLLTLRALVTNLRALRVHAGWSAARLVPAALVSLLIPVVVIWGVAWGAGELWSGGEAVDFVEAQRIYQDRSRLARVALDRGDAAGACLEFERALPHLRSLTAGDEPRWWGVVADFCFGYARAQERIGFYAAAQRNLEVALRQIHRVPDSWRQEPRWQELLGRRWQIQLAWARIWRRQGNLEGSLRTIRPLLEGVFGEVQGSVVQMYVSVLHEAERDEEALRVLAAWKKLQTDPISPRMQCLEFSIRRRLGWAEEDLVALRALREKHPDHTGVLACFQDQLLATGRLKEARVLFGRRAKSPGAARDQILFARLLGDVVARRQALASVLEKSHIENYRLAAASIDALLGESGAARNALEELRPKIPGRLRLLEARLLLETGELETALVLLESRLQDLPADPDTLQLAARIDLVKGRREIAYARIEQAVRFAEGNPARVRQLAWVRAGLLRGEGRFDEALEVVRSVAIGQRIDRLRQGFELAKILLEAQRPVVWEGLRLDEPKEGRPLAETEWIVLLRFWRGVGSFLRGSDPREDWVWVGEQDLEASRHGARFSVLAATMLTKGTVASRVAFVNGCRGLFEGWSIWRDFVLGLEAGRAGREEAARKQHRASTEANRWQLFPYHLVIGRLER